jgi:DNA-binding MarR family transcriptional regulator
MPTGPSLNPQVLGRAEAAHRALLERILAGTGLTYHRWVALSVSAAGNGPIGRRQLIERVTSALRIDDATGEEAITELTAADLLRAPPGDGSSIELTEPGRELHRRIRAEINDTITRIYSDISAADLATAGRVLSAITQRANAELAGAEPLPEPRA